MSCNTPNKAIRCSITNCQHHCSSADYCSLNAISIGTHEANPTQKECVDCESFMMK